MPTKKKSDSEYEDDEPTNFYKLNQDPKTDYIYLKDPKIGSLKKIKEEEKKMELDSDEDEKTLDLRIKDQKKEEELNNITLSSYPFSKK